MKIERSAIRAYAGLPSEPFANQPKPATDAVAKELTLAEQKNWIRKMAGLVITEKEEKEEPADDKDADKESKPDDAEEEPEDELPEIVGKLAKKAVGKDEEAMVELLLKVYQAGFSDGETAAKEEPEEGEEEAKPEEEQETK